MSLTSTLKQQLNDYPLGPNIRAFFDLGDPGEGLAQVDLDWQHLEVLLHQAFLACDLPGGDELSSILEELVMMDLPASAIALARLVGIGEIHEDFRCNLAIGAAAMLTQDLILGEACFRHAQRLQPEELAPYKNICEIFYRQHRDDACLEWAIAGLDVDPNAQGLWELIAAVYVTRFSTNAGEQLLELANKRSSWAGRSLASQYLAGNDPLFRVEQLSDLYNSGLRDADFLIEYTAALGVALEYEKIPAIVWQAESTLTAKNKKSLPWQLHAHAAQAYTALEDRSAAISSLNKALNADDLPSAVPQELKMLEAELMNEAVDHGPAQ
jgi:hypothetical protein